MTLAVVVGDANVDLEIRLPPQSASAIHANPDPQLFGGGSAANTAAALARLGVDCRFVGTVGDDSFGRFAAESLTDAGVDTRAMLTTRTAPTVVVVAIEQPEKDRLIYVWPPRGGAHGALTPDDAVAALAGASWLHVSGICLRLSPSREALLAAMSRARTNGVPVSFDVNLRLENWGWDRGFQSTAQEAVGHSDVVLGSASDEISALAGLDDPIEAALALAGDERIVVARRGAHGALACSRGGVVTAPGLEVEVVDTVGAGDAFDAGFIASRLRGGDLAESLRWGNAVAALAVAKPGARSTPGSEELEAFLAQ